MPAAASVSRKEGELRKYKNVFSGWGKRYFRLERSYLHYFETKHSHAPIATVTRGEIGEVKPSNAFPGRLNCFEIIHKSGVIWYCQASSPAEMVSWLQVLSTVPVVLDPAQYPTIPLEQAPPPPPPPPPPVNPAFSEGSAVEPIADSPYRDLMEQAHLTAYTSQTMHECRHYSPPPPYSAGGNQPPLNAAQGHPQFPSPSQHQHGHSHSPVAGYQPYSHSHGHSHSPVPSCQPHSHSYDHSHNQ